MIEISDAAHLRICRLVGVCEVLTTEEREDALCILVRTMRRSRVVVIVIPAGEWRTR